MPTLVNVQGVGQVSFPDGMSPEDMQLALQKNFPPKLNIESENNPRDVLKPGSKWDAFVNSPIVKGIVGEPSVIREAREKMGGSPSNFQDIVRSIMSPDKPGPAIPAIPQQQGKVAQTGAALANIGTQNIVNPIIHDPLSFALAGGALSGGGNLGRALSGLFAGQMASQVPAQATAAGTVVGDPSSTLQHKVEAVGAPIAGAAMTVGAGAHAIKGEAPLVGEVKQTPELQRVTKAIARSPYEPGKPEYKVDVTKDKAIPPQTKTNEKELQGREMVLTGPFLTRNAREEIGLDTSKAAPEQTINRLNNLTTQGKLSQTELQIYKDQGLEEYLKTKPTPEKLAEWMQEKGPRVVIDKKGEGTLTGKQKEFSELHHWMDSQPSLTRDYIRRNMGVDNPRKVDIYDAALLGQKVTPELSSKVNRMIELSTDEDAVKQSLNRTYWQSIAPKPEDQMPGYVEGAVVIPVKHPKGGFSEAKFPSSHSFPPNTLGFFRGYMEGDTFHVIEVQSDWAQRRREAVQAAEESTANEREIQARHNLNTTADDPLLKDWERLTLKAAIQHAISEGAKHIAFSDAETAMMTEGHDRATDFVKVKEFKTDTFEQRQEAARWLAEDNSNRKIETEHDEKGNIIGAIGREKKAPQEKGMRLHYDQILPKLAKELTGSEGVEKGFGEHRMAYDKERTDYGEGLPAGGRLMLNAPRKDLIFKDKSGAPKTTITAKSFDLSKAKERQAFSLFDKDKATVAAKQSAPVESQDSYKNLMIKRLGLDKPSSVGDVMRRIIKDKETYTSETVALAKFLDDHFSHVIDSAAISTEANAGINRASYSPSEHKVYLDLGGRESGQAVSTLLHESAHAAFHWLVETELDTAKKVSDLRSQVVKNLPKAVRDFYEKTYLPNILKSSKEVTYNDINKWFTDAGLRTDKWDETLYALQDNSEFAASIFNGRKFRDFLNEIPTKSKTLWAKVKEFVALALGIKPGTVLDKTFDTLLEGKDKFRDYKTMPDALVLAKDRMLPPLPSEKGGKSGDDVIWLGNSLFSDMRGDKKWQETFEQYRNKIAGYSAPKTMASSKETGNALIRYASARIASPLMARALASEVAGEHWNDQPWLLKFGALLTEDRLRAIRDTFVENGEDESAAKVRHVWNQEGSPIKDEQEFKALLKQPEMQAAIERFKKLIQEPTTKRQEQLGGKIAKSGSESGAFINLIAMHGEEGRDLALSGGSRKGDLTNPLKRGSAFNRQAKGTAEQYDFNFRNIAERMFRGNYEEGTKRDLYDSYVKSGLAQVVKSGEERPAELGGLPTQKITIDKGRGQKEDLWVRSDIASELRQALQTDSPVEKGGRQYLINALTTMQLVGPVDVTVHLRNMFSAIAGAQGGESTLVDLLRKIPGVRGLDTLVRIGLATKDAINQSPEVQKQLAKIAEIGGERGAVDYHGVLNKVLPTSKLVHLMDRSGRLALSKMYDNLVKREWVKESEEGRREFINKMGQYNDRLMSAWQQRLKESSMSPFVVAGKNFNRLALQRLTMDAGVAAANPQAALKMKLVEATGVVATLLAMPMVVNYYTTGNVFGRPGVKAGAIDTGKDDKQGRPIIVDLVQNVLIRRGLRNVGEEAAFKDMKQGKDVKTILQDSFMDMARGYAAPYEGPAVRFGKTFFTGYDTSGYLQSENPDSLGENLKAALKESNPSLAKYFEAEEEGTSKVMGVAQPLVQALGVSSGHKPSLNEKELSIPNIDQKSLSERAKLQKSLTQQDSTMTSKQKLEMSLAETRQSKALESQVNSDLQPATQKWLKSQGLRVPGFAEYLEQTGVKVYLLPKEREAYEKIMVQTYEEWLAKAKPVIEKEPTQAMKEKVLERFMKAAHGVARNRMRNLIGHIDE